jgi:hypothetical protein
VDSGPDGDADDGVMRIRVALLGEGLEVTVILLIDVGLGAGSHMSRICSKPWGIPTKSSNMRWIG